MDDDLGVAWLVKRLIVSKILKSTIAPDISDVDGAVLQANTAGKIVWSSMVPAIVKKLVGTGDLESEMASEYTHRLGEDLDNVSAKALKQGYTASLGKGIDRSLSWARVAEAWGLDGRQMRAFIGTMPKNDYSGEVIPSRSRVTLDTMINTRADRIRDNESYAIGQLAQQVHWVKLQETGEVGPDVTKRWHTAVDELVCPICGPINGKIVGLTKNFSRGVFAPPVHPNCRCWVELIEGSTIVTKRDYDRDQKGRFSTINTLGPKNRATKKMLEEMLEQERNHFISQGYSIEDQPNGDFIARPPKKRKATAYDIDGIIAGGNGVLSARTPNLGVIDQMKNDKALGYDVFIITNRPNGWRAKTEEWLEANGVPYDEMLMPPKDKTRAKKVLGDAPDSHGLLSAKVENILDLEERGYEIEGFYENDLAIIRGLRGIGRNYGTDEIDPEPATERVNQPTNPMSEPGSHPFGRDIGFNEGQPRPTKAQIDQAKANTRKLKGGKGGWDVVEGRPVDDQGNLLPGAEPFAAKSSTGEETWLLPTRTDRYYQTIYADWQDKNSPREYFTKDEYWDRLWERGTPYQHSLREDEIFTPEEMEAKKYGSAYKPPAKSSKPSGPLRELSFEPKRGEHEAMAELPMVGYERMVGFDRQGNYEPIKTSGGPTMHPRGANMRSHYVIDRRPDKPLWDSRALLMETKGDRAKYEAKMQRGHHLPYDVIMKDPRPQHAPIWGIHDAETGKQHWLPPGQAPEGWGLYMNVDFPMGWSGFYTGLTGKYRSHPSTSHKAPPAKFVKDEKALNNPYTPKGYKMPSYKITEEIYKRLKDLVSKNTATMNRTYARDKTGQFATQNTLVRTYGTPYKTIPRPEPQLMPQPQPMPSPAGPPRRPSRGRPIETLLTPAELREIERQMSGKTIRQPQHVKYATLNDALNSVINQPDTRRNLRNGPTFDKTAPPQARNKIVGEMTDDVREKIYDAKVRAGQTPIKRDPRYVVMEVDSKKVSVSTTPTLTTDPRMVFVNVAPKVGEVVSFTEGTFYATAPGTETTKKSTVMVAPQGMTVHALATVTKGPDGKTDVRSDPNKGLATGEYTVTSVNEITDDDTTHTIVTIESVGLLRGGNSAGMGWLADAPSPGRTGKEYDDPTRGSVSSRDLETGEDEPDYNDVIDIDADWEGDWDDEPKPRLKKPDKQGVDWNVETQANRYLKEAGVPESEYRLRRLDQPGKFRND